MKRVLVKISCLRPGSVWLKWSMAPFSHSDKRGSYWNPGCQELLGSGATRRLEFLSPASPEKPRGDFWFSCGPNPVLSRARDPSPSALAGLPGHSWGSSRTVPGCGRLCPNDPHGSPAPLLAPSQQGMQFTYCKHLSAYCFRRVFWSWGGVCCWPNLKATSSERGCIASEQKFMLCPQLLRQ